MLEVAGNDWMEDEENKDESDAFTLHCLSGDLYENDEWFIGYKILRMSLKYDDDKGIVAQSHNLLGSMISQWNICTKKEIDPDIQIEVENEYKLAIILDPGYSQYRYDYGNFLEIYARFEQAKIQYLKAIDLDPGNTAAMIHLAVCCAELDDHHPAVKYFKDAIEEDPTAAYP